MSIDRQWRRWIALALTIWLIVPAAASAQPTAIPLADYERLLRATYAATQRGDLLDAQTLAAELTAITLVRMPDGELAQVDQRWLSEALAGSNPDLAAVSLRLGAMIDALMFADGDAPAPALQQWESVWNEPPFHNDAGESMTARFFNWLFELIVDLLERLNPPLPEAPDPSAPSAPFVITPLMQILLVIGLVIVGGVIVFWLRGLRLALRAPVAQPATAGDPVKASDAQSLAEAALRAGDRRSAVRYLYLAALLWLDEQGVLRYDPSLTNREYLIRLAQRSTARDYLAPIVATFDAVWYGAQPIDAESFARYEQQLAALRAAVAPAGKRHEAAV